MIVKTHVGEGRWAVWEAEYDVRFLGHHSTVQLPKDDPPGSVLRNIREDLRFPWIELDPECCVHYFRTAEHDANRVRWAYWYTKGESHILITDGPIYICNDQGDTIEAIR